MSEPLLSTPKHDIKQLDTAFDSIQASKDIQTDEEESDEWHEITIEERGVCINLKKIKKQQIISCQSSHY